MALDAGTPNTPRGMYRRSPPTTALQRTPSLSVLRPRSGLASPHRLCPSKPRVQPRCSRCKLGTKAILNPWQSVVQRLEGPGLPHPQHLRTHRHSGCSE